MAPQREWFEKDYYAELGVVAGRDREGHHARLPQAGEAVPPRRQRGRRGRRGPLQGDLRRARRARRRREAQGVRPGPRDGRVRASARADPGGFGGFGGGAGPGGFGNVRRRGPRRTSVTSSATCSAGAAAGGRGAARARSAPQRGNDIETELHLDFLDAVHGITTSVNITSEAPCSVCDGTGRQARHRSPSAAPRATAPAIRRRRPGTVLVLRRSARTAVGAAAWSRTSASTARAAASRCARAR